MFAKLIEDFDKFSNEADIIVSDGQYDLRCYCSFLATNMVALPVVNITSFLARNIMRALDDKFQILKLKHYYSYHLQGKIIDTQMPIVCIGNIKIILDEPLPKDIECGEYISFDVERLDCEI